MKPASREHAADVEYHQLAVFRRLGTAEQGRSAAAGEHVRK